jgi:hypothetical protein
MRYVGEDIGVDVLGTQEESAGRSLEQVAKVAMTVSQVLVPTDFSASAEPALDYTMALARPLQARVILLHVISISAMYRGTGDVAVALPATYFEEL